MRTYKITFEYSTNADLPEGCTEREYASEIRSAADSWFYYLGDDFKDGELIIEDMDIDTWGETGYLYVASDLSQEEIKKILEDYECSYSNSFTCYYGEVRDYDWYEPPVQDEYEAEVGVYLTVTNIEEYVDDEQDI